MNSNHRPVGADSLRQVSPYRPPLHDLQPNIYAHNDAHGYRGMSAGVKFSRQQSGPFTRNDGIAVARPGGMGAFHMR